MKKILLIIAILIIPCISIAEEPWDKWVADRNAETQRIVEEEHRKEILSLLADLAADMTDLKLAWESRGPTKDLIPLVQKGKRNASRACFILLDDAHCNMWRSLRELENLLEQL